MSFETKAVAVVAQLLRNIDNSNPDVGMGWSDAHLVDQAAQLLQLTPAEFDRAQALRIIK